MVRRPPDWVRDAIFYQVFPDRFRRAGGGWPNGGSERTRERCGGDLEGIREALPYLGDLGVNALYLTPVFTASSYHRYDTTDYHAVDPTLGGNAALRRLVDEVHHRGMRIILDGVFNHCGAGHPFFVDATARGRASRYWGWFSIRGDRVETSPAPNYACWAGVPTMPEWNHGNPEARGYLLDVVRHWIAEYGIDGWRLDTTEYLPPDFVRSVDRTAKAACPEAYVVGEVMGLATPWFRHDALDGVMHYQLWERLVHFVAEERWDAERFSASVYSLWRSYTEAGNVGSMTLLGSHDKPRFLTLCGGDRRKLLLATAFLLCFPGAPAIYYGDEIGMEGGEDPDNRRCFPWDEQAWDRELRTSVRRLVRLRTELDVLRRGSVRWSHAHGRSLAFLREQGADRLLIALNADRTGPAAVALEPGGWVDLLTNARSTHTVVVPPLGFALLRRD